MLLAVIAAAWSPSRAPAGGPMSVLITDPATHRNASAYLGDARYRQLASAIGLDPARGVELPTSGESPPSGFGELFRADLRITWLSYDAAIWRIDLIFVIREEVWVATAPAWIAEPDQAVWRRATDPGLLRAVLTEAGLLDGSAVDRPRWAPTPVPVPTDPAVISIPRPDLLGPAVFGLALGVVGTLLLRRHHHRVVRTQLRPRATHL
jgi:hypothetical protein